VASKPCPFCGNQAETKTVGDAYNLDCGFCEIRIEISKTAYAIPCGDPETLLGIVRARMESGGVRPRIDRAAMQKPKPEAQGD
jgi:hypothetical protein